MKKIILISEVLADLQSVQKSFNNTEFGLSIETRFFKNDVWRVTAILYDYKNYNEYAKYIINSDSQQESYDYTWKISSLKSIIDELSKEED